MKVHAQTQSVFEQVSQSGVNETPEFSFGHILSDLIEIEKEISQDDFNAAVQPQNTSTNLSTKEAIERSDKIQAFFANDAESFMEAKLDYWANKDNPDYTPPAKYAKYLEQIQHVSPMDIILDGELVKLDDMEYSLHSSLAKDEPHSDSKLAIRNREWIYQQTIKTEENKYEDAPEFEAFINSYMQNGYTEEQALYRASIYAQLGLLDYGKQRAIQIDHLDFNDQNRHGFHKIDNPILKTALLETINNMDFDELSELSYSAFFDGQHTTSLNPDEKQGMIFQDLLNEYANITNNAGFDGNINFNDFQTLQEQSFIMENLLGYFQHQVNNLKNNMDSPTVEKEILQRRVDIIEKLIENINTQKDEHFSSFYEDEAKLNAATKSHRPNPLNVK